MQQTFEVSGQKRHQWLHVLLWIAVASACVLPAVTAACASESIPATTVQLPVSLKEWVHIKTPPPTDVLKSFKRGMDSYSKERYSKALEAFPDEKAAASTEIGDYLLFHRAKANLMLERNKEALNDFRLLESLYPDSPLIRESLLAQAQILLTLKDAKPALAVLNSPKIGTNSEAVYYQARALDLAGEKDKAVELYLRAYSRYPSSRFSPLAVKYLDSLSPGALRGSRNYDARLERAENLMISGNSRAARSLLQALGRVSAPNPAGAEQRNLLLGEAEYRLRRNSTAITYLRKVTARHPELHAKALYLEGACSRRLDRRQQFLALWDKVLKLYPDSPHAEELCYSVATYFDVNYEHENSREAYAVLYKAFPKGRHADRALWKLAQFSYLDKKYGEAALLFWKHLNSYSGPLSASSAMYWMGRCYEKLGDPSSAKYLYGRASTVANESYYGQRAREAKMSLGKDAIVRQISQVSIAGIDFAKVIAACDGIQAPPVALAEPDAAVIRVIKRARQLFAADLPDLALTELRWGRNRYPKSDVVLCYVMSRIYVSKSDYNSAIASLRRAFPDYNSLPVTALPDEFWDVLFPTRFLGTVSKQASRAEVDPALVLGVIRQESAFQEKARSRANARGLMQILPSTGRKLARQARIRYSLARLYQPETNITLGTRFLADLLEQYGEPELALAAYNAGPSRVDRWLEEWGDLDMAEFVEQIPFSETRGYVKQVLSNKVRYGVLIR